MPDDEPRAPTDGAADNAEPIQRNAVAYAPILRVSDLMARFREHVARAHETARRARALCAAAPAELDEPRTLGAPCDAGEPAATGSVAPAAGDARSDGTVVA